MKPQPFPSKTRHSRTMSSSSPPPGRVSSIWRMSARSSALVHEVGKDCTKILALFLSSASFSHAPDGVGVGTGPSLSLLRDGVAPPQVRRSCSSSSPWTEIRTSMISPWSSFSSFRLVVGSSSASLYAAFKRSKSSHMPPAERPALVRQGGGRGGMTGAGGGCTHDASWFVRILLMGLVSLSYSCCCVVSRPPGPERSLLTGGSARMTAMSISDMPSGKGLPSRASMASNASPHMPYLTKPHRLPFLPSRSFKLSIRPC
mmetsp:Transcript_25701/g.67249  ORF Transcript_25701/g.67249 Transcript_25701/m.67249 type:complete len:259 (+) Transcript_25701:259-1035(+)